jgi:hypothetical protein
MRKSRAISLVVLGAAMLVAGCGSRSRTFYDAQGKMVPRTEWRDANGNPKQLYDAEGKLVPPEEINAAYSATSGSSSSSYRRSSSWFGGSTRGGFGGHSLSSSS